MNLTSDVYHCHCATVLFIQQGFCNKECVVSCNTICTIKYTNLDLDTIQTSNLDMALKSEYLAENIYNLSAQSITYPITMEDLGKMYEKQRVSCNCFLKCSWHDKNKLSLSIQYRTMAAASWRGHFKNKSYKKIPLPSNLIDRVIENILQ